MGIADNPDALAAYVEHLGGEIVPHETKFRFEIPLCEARRVIPEINKLDLRCEKVSERQTSDVNGHAISMATIELRRQPEPTEYDDTRNLMRAIIR
jgi:hypothetical protein